MRIAIEGPELSQVNFTEVLDVFKEQKHRIVVYFLLYCLVVAEGFLGGGGGGGELLLGGGGGGNPGPPPPPPPPLLYETLSGVRVIRASTAKNCDASPSTR